MVLFSKRPGNGRAANNLSKKKAKKSTELCTLLRWDFLKLNEPGAPA